MTDENGWDLWAEVFARWAPFIDDEEGPHYAATKAANPGLSVELGCGDGRVTKHVLPDLAFDISERAVEIASSRLPKVAVAVADMCIYELGEPAQFTYCPQNTLNQLSEPGMRKQALARIYANTAPGGLFAFDVMSPNPEAVRRRNKYVQLRFRDESAALYTGIYPTPTGDVVMFGIWETIDEMGVVTERRHLPNITNRFLSVDAYRELIVEVGFVVEEAFGDFDGSPLSADSPLQIWHVRRPL